MRFKVTTIVCCLAFAIGLGSQAIAVDRISVAGGPLGGSWLPLGNALAIIISKNVADVEANGEVTEGSIQNVHLLGNKKVAFGIAAPNFIYDGYNGRGIFSKQKYPLRAAFATYPTIVHIIARKDSGIEKLADIKGKRVVLSPRGTGGANQSLTMLEAAGLTNAPKSIDYVADSEQYQHLADNKTDIILAAYGLHSAVVVEYTTSHKNDYLMIPVDPAVIDKMNEKDPFYGVTKIPAGTYPGQLKDVLALSTRAIITSHESVPDRIVYEFVKAVFTEKNLKYLAEAHRAYKDIAVETALDSIGIPLHPGARKYWEEQKHPKLSKIPTK